MRILTIFILIIAFLPSGASAEVYEAAIELQVGYAGGPQGWIPWMDYPAIGSPLWIVGLVQSFNAPFEGLPPAGTYEATYSFEALECTQHSGWTDPVHGTGGKGAFFSNGILRIYIDSTPDADFADISTFRDGELVLEASSGSMPFQLTEAYCPSEMETQYGYFTFSGGSWFEHVNDGSGRGYGALNRGCFGGVVSEALQLMGYIAQSSSQIDVYSTVEIESKSWGSIKALYR